MVAAALFAPPDRLWHCRNLIWGSPQGGVSCVAPGGRAAQYLRSVRLLLVRLPLSRRSFRATLDLATCADLAPCQSCVAATARLGVGCRNLARCDQPDAPDGRRRNAALC